MHAGKPRAEATPQTTGSTARESCEVMWAREIFCSLVCFVARGEKEDDLGGKGRGGVGWGGGGGVGGVLVGGLPI